MIAGAQPHNGAVRTLCRVGGELQLPADPPDATGALVEAVGRLVVDLLRRRGQAQE